ncbi:hypothetical protein JIG36_02315 [Actinoplanes sp. LDG1-06]|uniref:Uncharacterized protein n=1 Tax=Paractinoplanes ovalisporus TaxID=2810368 RepID=A0ABS2A564_9ACTN|nr:hypothetical protein [Actinoplanes ovalisporus]MBM2614391.1 hypothetical protein [Actinoplanes ovalisporus]
MAEMSPRQLVSFVRSLAALGLPADAQAAWISRLSTETAQLLDELALDFDDGFQLVPAFVELGWLNAAALAALRRLDAQLDAMSGDHNAELWSVDALAREEWDRVRSLARAALSELN